VSDALNPDQFLYHGTAMPIEGNRLLPARVHGKGSYWGDSGSEERGEPSQDFAWAHPDEHVAWHAAMDRVVHTSINQEHNPRARVYAVHPNAEQSPGHDASMSGEVKSSHFDIAHPVDTMPGRQGTFPGINWNDHVTHIHREDEDANHPSNLSAQFGHKYARWGDHWNGPLREDAKKEDTARYLDRLDDRNIKPRGVNRDEMLPGMSTDARRYQKGWRS
jgi:hypothetical protein